MSRSAPLANLTHNLFVVMEMCDNPVFSCASALFRGELALEQRQDLPARAKIKLSWRPGKPAW